MIGRENSKVSFPSKRGWLYIGKHQTASIGSVEWTSGKYDRAFERANRALSDECLIDPGEREMTEL